MKLIIDCICIRCERERGMLVNESDYDAWDEGKPIKQAFPYLSVSDRFRLLKGYCEYCQDELFTEDEVNA